MPDESAIKELVLQAIETEQGGVQVYRAALECAVNEDLRREWTKYLEQTERHVEAIRAACTALRFDPDEVTPGRRMVRQLGEAYVEAIRRAHRSGDAEAAQIAAAECVMLAETKDHQNWSLIGELAKAGAGEGDGALKWAHDDIEDEEDEHLYHTAGWARELWCARLGLDAVLPPPEERKDARSAIAAARAKQARHRMNSRLRSGQEGARAPGAP